MAAIVCEQHEGTSSEAEWCVENSRGAMVKEIGLYCAALLCGGVADITNSMSAP
jgi:hypothetical protein